MKLDKVILKDKKRLLAINSNKEPRYFYVYSTKKDKKNFLNHSIILNWGDKKHGCKFNCKFCSFRKNTLMQKRRVPSNKDIDKFLNGYEGYKVYISGGGDPLYEYEKNKEELNRIIDYLHSKGYLVNMITKEYKNALKIYKKINQFNFSTEVLDKELLDVIKKIKSDCNSETDIRVSIIFDDGKSSNFYKDYINFYATYVNEVCIREDYNKNNFRILNSSFIELLSLKSEKVVLLPAKNCDKSYYLVGDLEMTGKEMLSEKYILE